MRQKILLMLVAVFTATSVGWGQTSHKYHYLVNATNQMSNAISRSAAPNRSDLLRATAQACNALSMLLEDKQFHQDLSILNDHAPGSMQERSQLKRELDLFVSSFLRIEERWLLGAGLEERVAKEILWSASMYQSSIDADVTPTHVLNVISALRKDVCDGSRKLQSEEDSAKQWAMVKKWGFRIGGVTLIAVDVAGATATVGMSAPVAAGSAAIGAAVASWNE